MIVLTVYTVDVVDNLCPGYDVNYILQKYCVNTGYVESETITC